MSKHILSKSTYIRSLQCQKSLYLHKHRPFLRDRLSPEQLQKFRRGTDVGKTAHGLFPDGIDLTARSPGQYAQKVQETKEAIASGKVNVIYEAAFQYDEVLIFLDILVKSDDGWTACEVKSSQTLSSVYYADAALQYYVLKGSGIRISDFLLFHINPEYILYEELNPNELFRSESVINLVENKLNETKIQIETAKSTLRLKQSPDIRIGSHCNNPYPCDFKGHCWKNIPKYSILQLTTFDDDDLFDWYHKGISDPREVVNLSINETQKSQIDALISRSEYYNLKLATTPFPGPQENYAFVDVLFSRPAIPVISGSKPYEYVPVAAAVLHDDQQTDIKYFKNSQEDIISFAAWIDNILHQFDHLIIFDSIELLAFWQSELFKSTTANQPLSFSSTDKIRSIRNYLYEIQYFYPGLNFQSDQAALSLHCTDLPPLTDRHQMIHEATTADHNENPSGTGQKILEYLISLQFLYSYISSLK